MTDRRQNRIPRVTIESEDDPVLPALLSVAVALFLLIASVIAWMTW